MLLLLISFLQSYFNFTVPSVFVYSSTRMALSALTSLIMILVFGKFFIKKLYEWKIGDRIRSEDCPLLGVLHSKKQDTPTMGGILILFSLLISLFLWMDWKSSFTLILLLTTLVMGGLGAYDDYLKLRFKNTKGLSSRKKFGIQALFALCIASYLLFPEITNLLHNKSWFSPPLAIENATHLTTKDYALRLYIPFCKLPYTFSSWIPLILMFLFFIFVIVGSSNAVNLSDGLDGLASGLVMFAAGAFAIIAFVSNHAEIANYLRILYIEGSSEIAIYLAAIVGASLGFLWYNGYPAQVFMGDTGSLALGGILGVTAVLLKKELLLGIIGGVFVIETLSVILQVASYRLRNKKRIFLCTPIHHHFEYKGWPETKVVVRFWIFGLMLGILGIITLKFQ